MNCPAVAFPGDGDPCTADERVVAMLDMMHVPLAVKFCNTIRRIKEELN